MNRSASDSPESAPVGRTRPLDWAQVSGQIEPVLHAIERHARRRRQRRRQITVGAAAMALLMLVGLTFRPVAHDAGSMPPPAHTAQVSQPGRQSLPDGSVVELRDNATISFEFTPELRRVRLDRGEAHFDVAKNPARPFVVVAGHIDVRAIGTAFTVQHGVESVEVLVTEGRVAVAPTASTGTGAFVGAGQRVVVGQAVDGVPPPVTEVPESEMRERLGWRVPLLTFDGAPLGEVVALFNRHATGMAPVRLVLGEEALGRLPLSGALRADNVGVLLAILDVSYGLAAERGADGVLTLRRKR